MNMTIDLTAITTPFGLLDDATKAALGAHGGPYNIYTSFGWNVCNEPPLVKSFTYRVAPAPAYTKDIVPWDAVDDLFEWYARDEDGVAYFYHAKPTDKLDRGYWDDGAYCAQANCLKITRGTAPWGQSLQQRPKP